MTPPRSWLRLSATAALCGTLAAGPATGQLHVAVAVQGLNPPVAFVQDPVRLDVQYVVEQGGRIRVVQNGALLATDFLDLPAAISTRRRARPARPGVSARLRGERALLRRTSPNLIGDTVVARFTRSAGEPRSSPTRRRGSTSCGRPASASFRSRTPTTTAATSRSGPTAISTSAWATAESGNDPENRAQDPSTLLGKMLRIDVSVPDSDPRRLPRAARQPVLRRSPVAALPEIWDFGLRNPWRFSFDNVALGGTGALVIGDVGQDAFEEIDYEPARARGGRNYGWRNREGAHANIDDAAAGVPAAHRSDLRLRPRGRRRGDWRLRVSRARARARLHGPLLLRRPRRPRVVARAAGRSRHRRGPGDQPGGAHRRTRRRGRDRHARVVRRGRLG